MTKQQQAAVTALSKVEATFDGYRQIAGHASVSQRKKAHAQFAETFGAQLAELAAAVRELAKAKRGRAKAKV